MKIFITGSSGFIGTNLVNKLSKTNHQLFLQYNKNLPSISKTSKIKFIQGDLTNPKNFKELLNNSDILIHLAGLRTNWDSEKNFIEINSKSLKKLLDKKTSLKKIIALSSVYAMGNLRKTPANESHPLDAYDNYGISKIILEKEVKNLSRDFNIPYLIVRPSIVYGPGDNETGMVYKLISLIDKMKFHFIGNGQNLIHLIYIDDLVDGLVKLINNKKVNKTYILAGATPISLKQAVNILKKELKKDYPMFNIPKKPLRLASVLVEKVYLQGRKLVPNLFKKEPPLMPIKVDNISNNFYYDISLAQKELNFKPKVDYSQGFKKTVRWYLKQRQ